MGAGAELWQQQYEYRYLGPKPGSTCENLAAGTSVQYRERPREALVERDLICLSTAHCPQEQQQQLSSARQSSRCPASEPTRCLVVLRTHGRDTGGQVTQVRGGRAVRDQAKAQTGKAAPVAQPGQAWAGSGGTSRYLEVLCRASAGCSIPR